MSRPTIFKIVRHNTSTPQHLKDALMNFNSSEEDIKKLTSS